MQNILKLNQIAAWQLGRHLVRNDEPSWVATLPSLQRDAVWKPGQVELLWDSLFRGFPIGSLVISEELDGQKSRYGKLAGSNDPWPEKNDKRHLLDGQQRSNAIALGFFDPFAPDAIEFGSILWLDLCPDIQTFKVGTRHFFFRLTTSAHPWGYETSDAAGRLHAFEIQNAVKECGWKSPQGDSYQRPAVVDLWPAKSNKPIPVAWLLLNADKQGSCLWTAIQERCEAISERYIWARNAAKWLKELAPEFLTEIENGLRRALKTTVPFLEVSEETVHAKSKQEGHAEDSSATNISNVEHLFQRLNNGGSPITPEELQYSMIKAYWPGIEGTIDLLKPRPMRASRLALLGCRAAFSSTTSKTLHAAISISALRALKNDDQADRRKLMSDYFGLGDGSVQAFELHPPIRKVIELIDQWLLHRGQEDIGLPPVLRTAIAHNSPEVYLLLMVLAQRVLSDQVNAEAFRPRILAIATALHWFCYDQHRAVQKIFERLKQCSQKLTPDFFEGVLHTTSDEQSGVRNLVSPADLEDNIIVCPNEANLQQWNWEQEIIEKPANGNLNERARLENYVWPLLCQILWNRELLLFAQREWLGKRFRAFDNADVSAWEDHNRPWDYDHLLPNVIFDNVKLGNSYMRVCQAWGGTNGNFHILPFEENRSRGAKPAIITFTDPEQWKMMLVQPGELDAFSLTREGVKEDTQSVLRFVQVTGLNFLDQ